MKATSFKSGQRTKTILKGLGAGTFLFFLVKGLVWLAVFFYLAISAGN